MSLDNYKENKTALLGMVCITSLLGGLFIIFDNVVGYHWSGESSPFPSKRWDWHGSPIHIENISK
jgi:hypothetical protein